MLEQAMQNALPDNDNDSNDESDKSNYELDLSKIANVPIVMIAGTEDSLCSVDDTNELLQRINREDNEVSLTHVADL